MDAEKGRIDLEKGVSNLLRNLPSEAAPRAHWPGANVYKQTAIESQCFEDDATVHFERLRPLQSWAPLFGVNMERRTSFIVSTVSKHAVGANMKLNQSEIDALAETSAKNYCRTAWASPMAYGITAAIVYTNRQKFRFPFYTPDRSWFNPSIFPTKRFTILRGTTAAYAWHGLRFFAYLQLMRIATGLFYKSIIQMSIAGDILRDRRLARVSEAILKRIAPGVDPSKDPRFRRMQRPQPGDQGEERQPIDQSDMERRADSYRRVGLEPPSSDDFTPPGQQRRQSQMGSARTPAEPWQTQDSQPPVDWDPNETQSEKETRVRGFLGQSESGSSGNSRWKRTGSQQQSQQQHEQSASWGDSGLLDDDDDASPVSAASRRAEQAGARASSTSGGSSWDRLRQQAKADSSVFAKGDRSRQDTAWGRLQQDAAPADRDRQGTPEKESYTYSEDDAKDYAKSQAQKDFDAMLDAERKGESDSGRRWK